MGEPHPATLQPRALVETTAAGGQLGSELAALRRVPLRAGLGSACDSPRKREGLDGQRSTRQPRCVQLAFSFPHLRSGVFEIAEASGVRTGTKIIIHLKPDSREFANEARVRGERGPWAAWGLGRRSGRSPGPAGAVGGVLSSAPAGCTRCFPRPPCRKMLPEAQPAPASQRTRAGLPCGGLLVRV